MRVNSLLTLCTFLIMSGFSLRAGDTGLSPAGIRHPLARATGAEVWPSPSNADVPAGLIWRSNGENHGVILCLHGIQTHAAWFGPLARELGQQGWTVIAPDRRGSGVNTMAPFRKGHTRGARELLGDLDAQMTLARTEARGKPLLLLGTSWGSNLAGAWLASTKQTMPDGFIQLVPATRSQVDPTSVERLLVATMALVAKTKTRKVPFAPKDYLPIGQTPPSALPSWRALNTDAPLMDPASGEQGGNGVLLTRPTFGTLQAGLNLNRRARRHLASGLSVPTLVIQAKGDQIMKNDASWEAFPTTHRKSGLATSVLLEGGHGIQLDDPKGVAGAISAWWGKRK